MSTLCDLFRTPEAPASNAPRWRRLVSEQDMHTLLSSVQQGVPLLPVSKEPVARAPQGISNAQQWFNCLPEDTAKSIVKLRRAQLYSCNAQASPQDPPGQTTLSAANASAQGGPTRSLGGMARLRQVLSRQQPAPAAAAGTGQPAVGSMQPLDPAAPLGTTGVPLPTQPYVTAPGSMPTPAAAPGYSATGQSSMPPPGPANMSPLRRFLQPPQQQQQQPPPLPPTSTSPLRGTVAGPMAAGPSPQHISGKFSFNTPGGAIHRMFHPSGSPPQVSLDQLRHRTKTLFAGEDTNPLAAKLRPPNTRPTALDPGSAHSVPTLMPIQQMPSPGRPMPPPPPPGPAGLSFGLPAHGQQFGIMANPSMGPASAQFGLDAHVQQPGVAGQQFGIPAQPGMPDWQQQQQGLEGWQQVPEPSEHAAPVNRLPWYKDMSPQRVSSGFQDTFTVEKMNKLGNRMSITPEKMNRLGQRLTITPERMNKIGQRWQAATQRVQKNLSAEQLSKVGQRMSPSNFMPHNVAARNAAASAAAAAKPSDAPMSSPPSNSDISEGFGLPTWGVADRMTDPTGHATDQLLHSRRPSSVLQHASSAPPEELGFGLPVAELQQQQQQQQQQRQGPNNHGPHDSQMFGLHAHGSFQQQLPSQQQQLGPFGLQGGQQGMSSQQQQPYPGMYLPVTNNQQQGSTSFHQQQAGPLGLQNPHIRQQQQQQELAPAHLQHSEMGTHGNNKPAWQGDAQQGGPRRERRPGAVGFGLSPDEPPASGSPTNVSAFSLQSRDLQGQASDSRLSPYKATGADSASPRQAFGMNAEDGVMPFSAPNSSPGAVSKERPPMRQSTTFGLRGDDEDKEPTTRAMSKSGMPLPMPAKKAGGAFGIGVADAGDKAGGTRQPGLELGDSEFGLNEEQSAKSKQVLTVAEGLAAPMPSKAQGAGRPAGPPGNRGLGLGGADTDLQPSAHAANAAARKKSGWGEIQEIDL